MALDVRRYQKARERNPGQAMSISGSTFPGLVTLAVGVFIIVVGIILLAAFGVPSDITNNKKPLSGVSVVALGVFVCGIGVCVAMYLKNNNDKIKRARKRADQHQQQQQQQQQHQQQHHLQSQQQHQPYEPQQLRVLPSNTHNHNSNAPLPTSQQLYNKDPCNTQASHHKQGNRTTNGTIVTVYS